MDLPEWIDLDGRLAGLQELPIVLQLRAVNLRPSLHEALLRLRQAAVQALKRVDGEDSRVLLVERVKVCAVVLPTGFHEHPDDNSEEPRQFRHGGTLHRRHFGVILVGPTLCIWLRFIATARADSVARDRRSTS